MERGEVGRRLDNSMKGPRKKAELVEEVASVGL